MTRREVAGALLAALALASGACGVKAPPRPPVEPNGTPAAPPAAADPRKGP